MNGRNDLRALQDSFYQKVADFDLQRGERVELTGSSYKSNKEWNRNIAQARSYAESLAEEQRLDYAVKGILANKVNDNINSKINHYSHRNKELNKENNELRENFEALMNIQKRLVNVKNEEALYEEIEDEKKRAKYERDKFIDSLEFANIEDFFSISN